MEESCGNSKNLQLSSPPYLSSGSRVFRSRVFGALEVYYTEIRGNAGPARSGGNGCERFCLLRHASCPARAGKRAVWASRGNSMMRGVQYPTTSATIDFSLGASSPVHHSCSCPTFTLLSDIRAPARQSRSCPTFVFLSDI